MSVQTEMKIDKTVLMCTIKLTPKIGDKVKETKKGVKKNESKRKLRSELQRRNGKIIRRGVRRASS